MRNLLLLTGAVVFVDTLFFSALTPLLPHFAHSLSLGKTGAGVLAGSYPAGALAGALPSGAVAARAGVKQTVALGLTAVAICIVLFAFGDAAWELDTARFLQGFASAFTWTGALAWLVAGAPAARRGTLIGQAFAAAVAGALFGPVLGGAASVVGIRWVFGAVGIASLALVAWAGATESTAPAQRQPLSLLGRAFGDREIRLAFWFVVLPSLLFGTLTVLAPLRLAALGFGSVAIGAVFLCSAAVESANNVVVGRAADRFGPLRPLRVSLVASTAVAALLPWPDDRFVLAALVVCGGLAFGAFFTPGMTLLSNLSEARGLDHAWTFALVNLAWAPGQTLGAAGGGALAHATADWVAYLALAALCASTFVHVARRRPARTGEIVH